MSLLMNYSKNNVVEAIVEQKKLHVLVQEGEEENRRKSGARFNYLYGCQTLSLHPLSIFPVLSNTHKLTLLFICAHPINPVSNPGVFRPTLDPAPHSSECREFE